MSAAAAHPRRPSPHAWLPAVALVLVVLAACAPATARVSNVNFSGFVVGISDGDTITVLSEETCEGDKGCRSGKRQHRVRLADVDAPEIGQPYGAASRSMLSSMVYHKQVSVRPLGPDKYGRVVGQVFVDSLWVNGEMVGQGGAWVYRRYSRSPELLEVEAQARNRKLGLWSLQADQIMPPWQWRRDKAGRKAGAYD